VHASRAEQPFTPPELLEEFMSTVRVGKTVLSHYWYYSYFYALPFVPSKQTSRTARFEMSDEKTSPHGYRGYEKNKNEQQNRKKDQTEKPEREKADHISDVRFVDLEDSIAPRS